MSLNGKQRRELRARAHGKNPAVTVGAAGLTDAVLAEVDRALDDHELVKIRLAHDERAHRRAMTEQICHRLSAEHIQSLGKTALVYRAAETLC